MDSGLEQHTMIVHALLDSGSTGSFTTQDLVNQLGIQGEKRSLKLTTLESKDQNVMTTAVEFQIAPIDSDQFFDMNGVYVSDDIPIKQNYTGLSEDILKNFHIYKMFSFLLCLQRFPC